MPDLRAPSEGPHIWSNEWLLDAMWDREREAEARRRLGERDRLLAALLAECKEGKA